MRKNNLLIILLSLAVGGLITYWLYVRFKILFFIIFIPFMAIGGSLFRTLFRSNKGE